jgi:hypothetical protein
MVPIWKCYWSKVSWKVSGLPITFVGSSAGVNGTRGLGDGLDSVASSMSGVTGNVGRCGSVTGGTSGKRGSSGLAQR